MKIEFEIPDPKFRAGQVVRMPVGDNGLLYLYIESYVAIWDLQLKNDVAFPYFEGGRYNCAAQDGSLNKAGDPIRPGVSLEFQQEEFEESAVLIEWNRKIVTVDTFDNIDERCDNWEYQYRVQFRSS